MASRLRGLVEEFDHALGYSRGGWGDLPRYELFHAPQSICAQKVRVVLAHHHTPYLERRINPIAGDSYLPSYVHMRMLGCARIGAPLARSHSGGTSVAISGCDACVVPTLIDWKADEVIVDSKAICVYLDDEMPEDVKLRPKAMAADIDEELMIVDDVPNVVMLLEKSPDGEDTVHTRRAGDSVGYTSSRIALSERHLRECADDPVLVEAYSAKISKERHAAEQSFSPEAVKRAYRHANTACHELEDKLTRRGSSWLFGERVTMADLFWGVELIRLKNLGTATFWKDGDLPRVAQYVDAVEKLPAIREGLLEWKDALF